MACLALAAQAGCAGVAPPGPELRRDLGQIVVAADLTPPRQDFDTYAKGRLEGAARGGSAGAASNSIALAAAGLLAEGGRSRRPE
jgi:hypothetical protein